MIQVHQEPKMKTNLSITTKSKLLPCVPTVVTVLFDRTLVISRLEIEDTGTENGALDWIVNDIRVDGTSLFTASGDCPGDMFAANAVEDFVRFPPGTQVELIVTYIGFSKGGCCFPARIRGALVHEDLGRLPPDVHAVIKLPGTPDEEVVGQGDWHTPYKT